MIKKLHLINNERRFLHIKSVALASDYETCEKQYDTCVAGADYAHCPYESLDYCTNLDQSACINHSQDYCSDTDYVSCSNAQVDTCGIDHTFCSESVKYDITD